MKAPRRQGDRLAAALLAADSEMPTPSNPPLRRPKRVGRFAPSPVRR